tara:strand:- start:7 stop:750 length:744 start_codon:yes stop_codon:yes gene_type:complete
MSLIDSWSIKLIYRVLKTVFLSGLLVGILISGVQMLKVVPLIYKAENLGVNLSDQINIPEKTENLKLDPSEDEWMPEDGFERSFYTSISNVITGFAFSLMLVSVFLLRDKPVTFRSGFFWGVVGFFVFSVAPSLGLPPELPGKTAAALEDRQLWWLFTVIFTAFGIGLLTESKSVAPKILALILLLLPHIIGPPNPDLFETTIPKELALQFIFVSLLTSAFFWIIVGVLSAYLYQKWIQKYAVSEGY